MSLSDTTSHQHALAHLRSLVQEKMDHVDIRIAKLIESHIDLISTLSLHTVSAGGKRLRPMLTLAAAQLCNYQGQADIALATSVEFMHTATLLHDDVVDASDLRRGKQTANHIWGNKESILVGDFLLGRAFHLMREAQSLDVYDVLSNAAVIISEGEVMQLLAEGNLDVDEHHYIVIIAAKTAALFAAACKVGAIVANVSEEKQRALYDYGYHLGVAFQIVDDALDYHADQADLGKAIGDDFKEAKMTLPIIKAIEHADHDERLFWQRTFVDKKQHEGDLEHALTLIRAHHTIEYSLNIASDHLTHAKDALDLFDNSPMKQCLLDVLTFVLERNN